MSLPAATKISATSSPTMGAHQAASPHRLFPEQRHLLFTTMFFSALLSYVPDQINWISVSFSLSFGTLFLLNAMALSAQSFKTATSRCLTLFFLAVAVSCPNAILNGVSAGEWVRGAIPFLFLLIHFFLVPTDDDNDAQFIINSLHFAAIVWAIKILIVAGPELQQVLRGNIARLTYVTMDTLIPYGLLGFALSLFNPSPLARKWQWPLLALFLFLIIGCGYRSQILLSGLLILVYLRRAKVNTKIFWILGIVVFTGPLMTYVFSNSFADKITSRFERAFEEGGENRRVQEIQFALKSGLNRPLLGNGLGYPVPLDAIDEFGTLEWVHEDAVAYIHNVWFYFLMDLGFPGFLSYSAFVLIPLYSVWRRRKERDYRSEVQFCAGIALGSLMVYASCQAAFRGIQFNLMIALLAAIAGYSGAIRPTGNRK